MIDTVVWPNVWQWGQPQCEGSDPSLCCQDFSYPVAVDGDGTLYWVNGTYNQRIMRMEAGGLQQDEEIRVPSPDGGELYVFDAGPASLLGPATDPAGQQQSTSWGPEGMLASVFNPISATLADYEEDGTLGKVTGPTGGYVDVAHQVLGDTEILELSSRMDRKTRIEQTKLDATSAQVSRTGPDGVTVTSVLRPREWTTQYPDGTTLTGTVAGDARFGEQVPRVRSVTVTTPSGLVRHVTTDQHLEPLEAPELIRETTTVNGKPWTSTLQVSGGVLTSVSPEGRTSQVQVNAVGQVVRSVAPNVLPVAYHYDASGRLLYAKQGERDLHLEYDEHGNVAVIRDHDDPTVVYMAYTNDEIGRPTSVRPAATSYPVSLQYDASSNVTSVTTPKDYEHTMSYVAGSMLDVYAAPAVGDATVPDETHYDYDADDQLERITTPAGQQVRLQYDQATGRLHTVVEPTRTLTAAYDPVTGMTTGVSSSDGISYTFTYDGSLPTSVTSEGFVSGVVSWTHDPDHRIRTETAAGVEVEYAYDDDGLVSDVGDMVVHTDLQDGRLTGTTLGATTDTYGYNDYGEVDGYAYADGSVNLYEVAYRRDALGRIWREDEVLRNPDGTSASAKSRRFTYHPDGRLHEVYRVESGGLETLIETYAYDRNGNRTNGGAEHDEQDRLTRDSQHTYQYDGNGALSSKTGADETVYEHDVHGRLVRVARENAPEVTYRVDPAGRRAAKLLDGQVAYKLLYRSGLQPVAMQDAEGNATARFVYALGRNVPDYMISFEGGMQVVYRIVADPRGSVRLVVRLPDGEVMQRLSYDEWGVVTEDTNPGFQPFGYAGGIYDPDTGLVLFGARDYDPSLGRWTSKDPLRFGGGDVGLYNYAGSDPINRFDPGGEAAILIPVVVGVLKAGAIVSTVLTFGAMVEHCEHWEGYVGAGASEVGGIAAGKVIARVGGAALRYLGPHTRALIGRVFERVAARGGAEVAGAGAGGRVAPFNPSGSMKNCVNGVCAFLKSVKHGRKFTASADVAENLGLIDKALTQIRGSTGVRIGLRGQFNQLATGHPRQFFVVFRGSSRQVSDHVAVGIVNNGRPLIYDPQIGRTYYNLADFGSFTAYPLLL